MLPKQLKAIFFDMDGVLIYSERRHFDTWVAILKELNQPAEQLPYEPFIGCSDLELTKYIINEFNLDYTAADLYHIKKQKFIELAKQPFNKPAGRDDFLQQLAEIRLAVVSSSSPAEIEATLMHEGIAGHFQFTVSNEDVVNTKPNPEPYQLALNKMKVPAENCLVIEDSNAGIAAAQAAGIATVVMRNDDIVVNDEFKHLPAVTNYLELATLLS